MSNSVDCWVACGSIGPEKAEEVAVSVDVVEQVQDVAVGVGRGTVGVGCRFVQ